MFFVLSKIFWFFARPLTFLFFLALAAYIAGRLGLAKTARAALLASVGGFVLLGFTQFPDWMLHRLEQAVPAAQLPASADAIIVLGGGLSADRQGNPGRYNLADAGDRLITGLVLKRRYREARLIYSGGDASLIRDDLPEALAAGSLVAALFGNEMEIELEDRSRNTWQNGQYVRDILATDSDGTILLVTSAFHMKRAVGVFARHGLKVIPVPTDFRADRLRFPFLTGKTTVQFLKSSLFVKEYLGILAYGLTGRMSAVLQDERICSPGFPLCGQNG